MLDKPVLLARIGLIAPIILSFVLVGYNPILDFIVYVSPSALMLYCFRQFSIAYNNPRIFMHERNSFIIFLATLLLPYIMNIVAPIPLITQTQKI